MSPVAALSMPMGSEVARPDDERSTYWRILRRGVLLVVGFGAAWLLAMLLHSPTASADTVHSPAPSAAAQQQQPVAGAVQGIAGVLNSVTGTTLPGVGQLVSQVPAIVPTTLDTVQHSPLLNRAPAVKKIVHTVRTKVVKPLTRTVIAPVANQLDASLSANAEPVERIVHTLTTANASVSGQIGRGQTSPAAAPLQLAHRPETGSAALSLTAPAAPRDRNVPAPAPTSSSSAHAVPNAASAHRAGGRDSAAAHHSEGAPPTTPTTPATPLAPAAPAPAGPTSAGSSGPAFAAVQTETVPVGDAWCAVVAASQRHSMPNAITDDPSFSPD